MKIRNDFVTNSSSSCFVIAYKSVPEIDEQTLDKYPFLKGYQSLISTILFSEGSNETTTGKSFATKAEWDQHFIKEYGWSEDNTVEEILEDDDGLKETYDEVVAYLEKGYNILDKWIDYDDKYGYTVIHELSDNENFIFIREDS